jgi:hypothetical protein
MYFIIHGFTKHGLSPRFTETTEHGCQSMFYKSLAEFIRKPGTPERCEGKGGRYFRERALLN